MTFINPTNLRRLLSAGVLAAAATLGGSAIGDPATASAAPKDWVSTATVMGPV